MSGFARKIGVVIVAILVGTAPCNLAFAEIKVSDFEEEWAQNDILFYNPAECTEGGGNKTCVLPTGDQITWIGDSYSVGAQSIIEAEFSGISFGNGVDNQNSYIQVSKTVSGGSAGNPSGFTILQDIINGGGLKPYLVFALGTNDGWDNGKVEQFNSIMAGHDDTQVVLVNSKTLNNNYAASNATLSAMAEAHSNYHLADWASVAKNEYYANDREGIHPVTGYAAWVDVIKEALPKNCSGELCGSNAREKYWSALSNHFGPAVAAGVMGNIDMEGGYSPTMMEQTPYLKAYDLGSKTWVNGWSWDSYFNSDDRPTGIGAFQITSGRASYLHYINDTEPGLIKYFKDPGTYSMSDGDALMALIGEEDFDKMVGLEIEWMYKTLEGHFDFDLNAFQNMSDAGEAAKYFLIHYERPANQSASMQQQRAEAGQKVYSELKDFQCSTGGQNSGSGSAGDTSSGSNVKYDATDAELEKILKFAVWESEKIGEGYRMIISKILDNYEIGGSRQKGNTAGLINYMETGADFIYRNDYDEYARTRPNVTINAEQLETAKVTIIDGGRTTTAGKSSMTNDKKRGVNYCSKDNKKAGNGKIAETAALMSWPVQNWQTEADDYKEDRAGYCNNGSGWQPYVFDTDPCKSIPRDFYRNNVRPGLYGWLDCGVFALGVLRYLDLVTDEAAAGGQPGAGKYFRAHPDEWQEVDAHTEADLKPGDVIWDADVGNGGKGNHGHIIIYVGQKYGGEYGNIAHASAQTRVGEIGSLYSDLSEWTVFRYVGDKLGGGDIDENGLTFEQAVTFMKHYGANKNDSSRNAAPYTWDNCNGGGSNCVTFSNFFLNKFTDTPYAGGDGSTLVGNLSGAPTGSEPKVWAVFSVTPNHTGVILGYHDGKWIVGHASCSNPGRGEGSGVPTNPGWLISDGSGIVVVNEDINAAMVEYGNPRYAYPRVDMDKISTYLDTGE